MAGFFSKLFGGKKSTEATTAYGLAEDAMKGIIEKANFDLKYTMTTQGEGDNEEIHFNIEGADAALLTAKEGALLDSIQMFIKRVIQHQLPESRVNVQFDCNGYREEANKSLVELAEKLRDRALEQGRSVYFRALHPKDRKVVHQFLASDERIRSRSVGEGLFKKIKIYPVKNAKAEGHADNSENM
jgi:spoIIIJ-associated protein